MCQMDGYSNPKNHSATHELRSTAANPPLSFLDDFLHDVKSKWSSSKLSGSSKKQTANDGNFKMKVMEAWNNFKFEIWDTLSMKQDSPVWLLGNCYHIQNVDGHVPMKIKDVENIHEILAKQSTNQLEMFFCDLYSIPWFTYRKGFSPINDTKLTSDTGWGCMLRTAQMMVAQCLCKHFLGCGWRWVTKSSNSFEAHMHQEIIKWFLDDASPECPFSVHRLTELGLNYQCNPGDWYGPGTVAYIMQDAMECAKSAYTQLNQLVLYVAQDCTVYSKDVKEMCGWRNLSVDNGCNKSKSQEVAKKSVLILIPVRLGEATLNSVYIPCLQALLTLDQTMGIIGGKRTHSLYFVGFQDEHLICLDPHYCQSADSLLTFTHDSLTTYHSLSPKKIAVSKLDPSCCLCFYCRDESDFQSFVGEFNKCIIPPKQKTKYPLCVIQEGSSRDYKMNLSSTGSNFVSSFEVNEKVVAANQAHCLSQTKPDNAIAFSDSSENLPQEKCSSCSKVTHNTKQRTDKLSFSLPIKFLTSFSGNQTCSAERRDSSHEDEFEFL